jgi:hypothetical protein
MPFENPLTRDENPWRAAEKLTLATEHREKYKPDRGRVYSPF